MGKIFAEGATLSNKILTVFILMALLIALTGMFFASQVMISEAWIEKLLWPGIMVAALFNATFIYSLFNKQSTLRQNLETQNHNLWGFAIVIPLVTFLVVHIAATKGIPVVGHFLTSSTGYMDITVKRKTDVYSGKSCDGTIYSEQFTSFFNEKICGIQQDDWNQLAKGDLIRLHGEVSSFGISYDRYAVEKSG